MTSAEKSTSSPDGGTIEYRMEVLLASLIHCGINLFGATKIVVGTYSSIYIASPVMLAIGTSPEGENK